MTVKELNREQIEELKQRFLTENADGGISYGELADADSAVSDEEIFREYEGVEFSPDDFFSGRTEESVVAYIAEMAQGQYLHINATEDGDGTWFDFTPSLWASYWNTSLENLKEIAELEFSDFPKGYPKYHKVKFDWRILETV